MDQMKIKWLFCCLCSGLILISCDNRSEEITHLQKKVDSLQRAINDSYKPGLGEFMSSIQVHHEKLYFAGENENWKLADFEIHEIMEAVNNIRHYAADRPEVKEIPMLIPALDSLNSAIVSHDKKLFQSKFVILTNTCNSCHKAVDYQFNMVKVPETPPFSNQVFKAP